MVKKWFRSRNADVDTIQAKDELDDLGSEAPGAGGIPIPVQAKFIRRVIVAVGFDGATLGNLVHMIRLEGDGMVNDETLMTDGFSVAVATGTGNQAPALVSPILNFPVNGGSHVKIYADSEGDAESNFETGVTLELVAAKEPPTQNVDAEIRTRSYAADMDTVDTVVDLTASQGSNANPSKIVPQGVKVLRWIKVVHGVDEAANSAGYVVLVRLRGDWIETQPHTIMCIGGGHIAGGDAGADEGVRRVRFFLDDINLEVTPGATIEIDGENAGADPGNGVGGITLGFA